MTNPGEKETKQDDRVPKEDRRDEIAFSISSVLQTRRWEMQEGPFKGFNSPPGRF
jgi:hypothetical protein